MEKRIVLFFGSLAYFGWNYFFVGLRPEHVGLYVALAGLYVAHPETRRFVLAFSAFIIYWIVYDSMRVIPNYMVNPVHVAEPYNLEKALFGLTATDGQRLTLNEYFAQNTHPFLDVLTGLFYLNWVPIPLLFAYWLFRHNKPLFLRFSYGFLFTNLLGFLIYYLYPAAPPWYIELHGFELHFDTPGNPAGLLKFDAFFGIHLFAGMYSKSANVFAAIPSLHSAYPMLCLLYGWKLQKKWLNIAFAIFVAGVWFAAVYTRHHYVIDVIAGAVVAVGGYLLFEFLTTKTPLRRRINALQERL